MKNPGKKMKETCERLGNNYEIKTIDLGQSIYRDLGNGYDFEIIGLNNQKKDFDATIYIWEMRERKSIVEKVCNIKSFELLKETLETQAKKYLKIRD